MNQLSVKHLLILEHAAPDHQNRINPTFRKKTSLQHWRLFTARHRSFSCSQASKGQLTRTLSFSVVWFYASRLDVNVLSCCSSSLKVIFCHYVIDNTVSWILNRVEVIVWVFWCECECVTCRWWLSSWCRRAEAEITAETALQSLNRTTSVLILRRGRM